MRLKTYFFHIVAQEKSGDEHILKTYLEWVNAESLGAATRRIIEQFDAAFVDSYTILHGLKCPYHHKDMEYITPDEPE